MRRSELIFCGGDSDETQRLAALTGIPVRLCSYRALHSIALSRLPVLVLIDCCRDPASGTEACRAIKMDFRVNAIPVLCITKADHDQDILDAFSAGADDCLSRPMNLRVLAAHAHAVLRRFQSRPVRKEIRGGSLRLDLVSFRATLRGKRLDLRPAEFSILELLLRNRPNVVRRADILRHIRRAFAESLSHTVEAQISNLRTKLGPSGRRLIRTVHGVGYRFAE